MTREEAIEVVKERLDYYERGKRLKAACEVLIPELAESEDERIRRWLCDYFSSIDKAWIHKDITCIDILRWLEKQKEQKQEKFPPYVTGFKGHPDPAGTSDLEEAAKEYASKTLCDPDDGPSTGLAKESFIAGAEWQKEQKLLYYEHEMWKNCEANFEGGKKEVIENPEKYGLQKPAEWSDTNELVFKDICNHLEVEGYSGWVVLLNALRNGEFQSKQEWSEEDEEILKLLILNIGRYMYFGGMSSERILSFLKSLRPQCYTDVMITPNTNSGTSTLKAEG